EWLKEHAWKVCIRQRIGGSNPPLTAIFKTRARTKVRAFFFYILRKEIRSLRSLCRVALRLPDLQKASLQPSLHTLR
ncbi:hypothetical protein CP997_21555, partial [Enterobacter hormaechei]